MWSSEKTDEYKRGDYRVVVKFAWWPTKLGYGDSDNPLQKLIGKTVWLERYESHQSWFDSDYDQNYRWRENGRLPIGFVVPKPPPPIHMPMLFPEPRRET